MVFEEMMHDFKSDFVDFLVRQQLFIVLRCHRDENHLGEIAEDIIVIVLTDCKVYVVSCDNVKVKTTDYL